MADVVAVWYGGLEREVAGKLATAAKGIGPSNVKAPELNALLFDLDAAHKSLAAAITPVLARMFQETGEEALAMVEISSPFNMDMSHAEELLRNRSIMMRSVAETAQGRVRRSLAEGIANGETVAQLQERVLVWARAGKEQHAQTVARTETGVVMNRAALDGYEQSGATGKEWLAILDEGTRDDHAALDGVVVGINETFDVGGTAAYGPGDPVLPIEEVANCRCTTAPVYEAEEGPNE